MKEIELPKNDKTEMAVIKPINKTKFLARIRPHKGHTCYSLNINTGDITVAEFESIDIQFNYDHKKTEGVTKRLIVQESCVYVTALNTKNAIKKFKKYLVKKGIAHI